MLTKEYITTLKHNGNGAVAELVGSQRDVASINFVLENLGQLPHSFDGGFLYDLLAHQHGHVRLNAVKNIGKLNGSAKIDTLFELYKTEQDTTVKREIVSSIGIFKTKILN